MSEKLDLVELGNRLHMVDDMLVQMLAARHLLALQVGRLKLERGDPIYRPGIEAKRIEDASQYGSRLGLSPAYVASVMYAAIRESCMDQVIQREGALGIGTGVQTYEAQKANLRALTQRIAGTYDATYKLSPATRLYLDFEDARLEDLVQEISRDKRGRFLDLGCGTGAIAFRACYLFNSVVGYDLSPDMLSVASEKWRRDHADKDVQFKEADLEDGISEESGSASFVAMTLGTASDIKNIEHVIGEIVRVLEPRGRFLLSFYNENALLYEWKYLPWQMSLAARINLDDHCLDVRDGDQVFQVYARPYSTDGVKKLFAGVELRNILTYPTISPVLPSEAFIGQPSERLLQTVTALDRQLSFGHHGAYIIVMGTKQ